MRSPDAWILPAPSVRSTLKIRSSCTLGELGTNALELVLVKRKARVKCGAPGRLNRMAAALLANACRCRLAASGRRERWPHGLGSCQSDASAAPELTRQPKPRHASEMERCPESDQAKLRAQTGAMAGALVLERS